MMHHQHQEIHHIHHEAKLADDENEEFDIHKGYHNAIDCLMHCEHIINDLQGQVTQKDEQIATLEEKLVQMSLELASAKAAEDVLDNINRQLSQSLNSPSVSETDRVVGQAILPADNNYASQQQTQSSSSRIATGYAPQKGSSRKNSRSMRPQYRSRQLSQSWTGSSSNNVIEEQQATAVATTQQPCPSVHQAIGNTVTSAARNLTRTLSKRGNWDANSFSRARPSPWGGNTNDDSSTLDASWKSANSSTKENMSLGSSARSAPPATKPKPPYHRCESSPSIYNMNGMRRTANMDESHPTRRQRRCSEVSSNSGTNVSFHDDESITQRRLSSIGQLLGFTNRNSAADVAADVVAGHYDNAAYNTTTSNQHAQQWQQGQQHQDQRRDSISSSRSDISGVLFPVTSSDCLIGLEKKINNSIESASSSRRGSGNVEW